MDSISGGSIPTDGVVKLTIDSDKIGCIVYPDGSVGETTLGVIDNIWGGDAGSIIYYVPKTSVNLSVSSSDLAGNAVYNGNKNISIESCILLTSFTIDKSLFLFAEGCTILSEIIAPKVVELTAISCALTYKSIGDILYAAYVDNRMDVAFDFTLGTNAIQSAVASYVDVTYGVELVNDIIDLLVTTNGGIISLNP